MCSSFGQDLVPKLMELIGKTTENSFSPRDLAAVDLCKCWLARSSTMPWSFHLLGSGYSTKWMSLSCQLSSETCSLVCHHPSESSCWWRWGSSLSHSWWCWPLVTTFGSSPIATDVVAGEGFFLEFLYRYKGFKEWKKENFTYR